MCTSVLRSRNDLSYHDQSGKITTNSKGTIVKKSLKILNGEREKQQIGGVRSVIAAKSARERVKDRKRLERCEKRAEMKRREKK